VRRVAEAQHLRAAGLSSTVIAARLGVAPSTVRGWLSDQHATGSRARKRRYGACCWTCGRATTGNQPGHARPLCPTCRAQMRRRWTRTLVEQRIREWRARYGTDASIMPSEPAPRMTRPSTDREQNCYKATSSHLYAARRLPDRCATHAEHASKLAGSAYASRRGKSGSTRYRTDTTRPDANP
jgi:hypothetical protein